MVDPKVGDIVVYQARANVRKQIVKIVELGIAQCRVTPVDKSEKIYTQDGTFWISNNFIREVIETNSPG